MSIVYRACREIPGRPVRCGREAFGTERAGGLRGVLGTDPQMQAEAGGRRAPPPFLVIVRREAQELYGALQVQFADEVHVRVIWDRRVGERRVHGAPMAVDRRGGDRRGPPPVSWGLGVVFVPQWMGKPERDRPLRPGGP